MGCAVLVDRLEKRKPTKRRPWKIAVCPGQDMALFNPLRVIMGKFMGIHSKGTLTLAVDTGWGSHVVTPLPVP